MIGRAARTFVAVGLLTLLLGCSAPRAPSSPKYAVKDGLEAALAQLPADAPLTLRYNPAPCDCPAFELQLGTGWLRAELVAASTAVRLAELVAWLAQQPAAQWPIAVKVRGSAERELLRTTQGIYAVRVEVAAVITPQPPAPAPAAEPTAEPETPNP
ncbi:MAG: hypothetical protein H6747_02200 [Deltaproteobacteria bacterium]|nr:hypothetical protein [Deltaproteobacteria bacterium]